MLFLVTTIYSISSVFSSGYKNDFGGRIEINIKSQSENQDRLISYSDVEDLKSYFSSGYVSYMNEMDTLLGVENTGYPVKAVMSGENLDNFSGLNILRGDFFSSDQYENGNKVAVISETLAQKLFTTHNIIGNEINMFGSKYKIIGLYQNKNSLLSLLTSDGIERVYIPFESFSSNNMQTTVNTVFIKDQGLQDEPFKEYKLESILREQIDINTDSYKINDFYNSSIYTSQPLSAFIFLVGILNICILIKYLIKYLKFGLSWFKNQLNSKYFLEVLTKWKLSILLYFLLSAMLIVFIGAVFWIVRFKGGIPYEYIPADNIFDLGFYANKVKEAIYNANSNIGYVPTQHEILFRNNLVCTYVLMVFLIINFIAVMSTIKLDKIVSQSIAKQMVVLFVSLFIGLAVSFVFCLVCGIQYCFPIRKVVVLVLFLSAELINTNKSAIITNKLFESVSRE